MLHSLTLFTRPASSLQQLQLVALSLQASASLLKSSITVLQVSTWAWSESDMVKLQAVSTRLSHCVMLSYITAPWMASVMLYLP